MEYRCRATTDGENIRQYFKVWISNVVVDEKYRLRNTVSAGDDDECGRRDDDDVEGNALKTRRHWNIIIIHAYNKQCV